MRKISRLPYNAMKLAFPMKTAHSRVDEGEYLEQSLMYFIPEEGQERWIWNSLYVIFFSNVPFSVSFDMIL